jgi:hypothetical protein
MKLPRFSLRTLLLLVAIIGVLLGCVVRQINWIRQRYEAAAKQEDLARRQATIDHFAVTPKAPWLGQGYLDPGIYKKNARPHPEIIRPFGSGQNVIYDDDHVNRVDPADTPGSASPAPLPGGLSDNQPFQPTIPNIVPSPYPSTIPNAVPTPYSSTILNVVPAMPAVAPQQAPSADARPDSSDLAVFIGGGTDTIDQCTLDGTPRGKVGLAGPAYGLVHRGDSLAAAVPGIKNGAGEVTVVHADGKVTRLEIRQQFAAPIAIALDPKSQNLLIADNDQNAVSCVLANDPGEVDRLFPAPLTAGQKHFPNMSIAATKDGRVVFGTDDPKGIYRMRLWPRSDLPNPIIKADATVAADPTTTRWVAMFQGKLTVFDGGEMEFSVWPPPRTMFGHYRVMAFSPNGDLYLVLQGDSGVEIDSLDLHTRKFTKKFTWKGQEIKSIAVGPKFDWDRNGAATPQRNIRRKSFAEISDAPGPPATSDELFKSNQPPQ